MLRFIHTEQTNSQTPGYGIGVFICSDFVYKIKLTKHLFTISMVIQCVCDHYCNEVNKTFI